MRRINMEKIIISGFGGQGVLFVGKLLAYTGMVIGKHVSWIPSYGPEMRGGTANCSVILSNKEITSPIVNHCTSLIAFNEPSIQKFYPQVEENGKVFCDITTVPKELASQTPLNWITAPISELASEIGSHSLLNMIMLGVFIKENTILTLDDLFVGMEEMIGNKKPQLIEANKQAILIGYQWKGVNTYV
jgi:2-oxoglutarate ferredoxin oxidoreductase subunit gamma